MASEYCIVIKSKAGIPLRVLTGQADGFLQLSYRLILDDVGLLMFDLDGDHGAIADLERDGQIEAWWRDAAQSVDWYQDFGALFLSDDYIANDDGDVICSVTCPEQSDLLGRALVAWPANVANRSLFSGIKGETILKTLVTYNAVTASATVANGRITTTDIANISVESDSAGGNVVTYACAEKPLLEVLKDVALLGDRDFWLERTGAQAWTFRTAQYRGTDRSTSVIFALNFGNMGRPSLKRNRLNEKTKGIVGGQGTDSSRTFVVRTSANYDASTNSREVFIPATEYSDTNGLNAVGDVELERMRAKDDLAWEIIQTPGSLYRVHYFFGDLVTGKFQDASEVKQIASVLVNFAPGSDRAETVQIGAQNI